MVFPVVMYGCESWTIKKAECWRIDAFELWCWRRLLRVPWTARRFNQSILKEISPEQSLEELMLKLKLQYFGHLVQRADSLEKTLMLGKIEVGRRGTTEEEIVGWHHQLNGHEFWWWTGRPCVLQSMGSQRVRHDWVTELNWIDGSDGKESAWHAGGPGLIPGSGRFPGEGNDYLLQYFCLENSMDRGAWWARVQNYIKNILWLA